MTIYLYPCLQCAQLTESPDKYVICDRCLDRFEVHVSDESRRRREVTAPRRADSMSETPLSPDEVDERVRRLLDAW